MRYKHVDQDQEIEDTRPKVERTSRHMTKTSRSKGLYVIFEKALWRTSADVAAMVLSWRWEYQLEWFVRSWLSIGDEMRE
jgi:hypothetical protein